ncbi:MAG: hypothetical protein ACK4NC_04300 [Candidatus Gracilibacteria bacterium]
MTQLNPIIGAGTSPNSPNRLISGNSANPTLIASGVLLSTTERDSLLKIEAVFGQLTQEKLKAIRDLEDRLNEVKAELDKALIIQDKKFKQELKKQKDSIENDKIRVIELLGIFVAIFTFFSIEVQILKAVTDFWRIGGLTIIMLGGIVFLVLLSLLITEFWIKGKKLAKIPEEIIKFLFGALLLILLGAVILAFGDKNNPAVIENNASFIEQQNRIKTLEQMKNSTSLEMNELKVENEALKQEQIKIKSLLMNTQLNGSGQILLQTN